MYDFTHCISDAIENITHSLCTLEFEDHRDLYEWVIEKINHENQPQQIEFARLALEHNLMSKRKLNELVEKKICRRLGRSENANVIRHETKRLYT